MRRRRDFKGPCGGGNEVTVTAPARRQEEAKVCEPKCTRAFKHVCTRSLNTSASCHVTFGPHY